MAKIPPYLKPGDTIGLICPAGFMSLEDVQACTDILHNWGFKVKVGATVGKETGNYFSGTDLERLEDLQQMLDDKDIQAILCARGGYGLSRIVDHINFKKFKKEPKWIIGYSDVTVLHAHISSNFNIATMHAPMAAAFKDGLDDNPFLRALKWVLLGKNSKYSIPSHPFNKTGEVTAKLTGGNLCLLAHLTGSSSEVQTKDKILFFEDIGEYLYNIDRMMMQLKRSGKLKALAGLIVGGFTELKDTARPFGATAEEIIRDAIAEYDYPVCFGFPVGHAKENYPLKIGVNYTLRITKNRVLLED